MGTIATPRRVLPEGELPSNLRSRVRRRLHGTQLHDAWRRHRARGFLRTGRPALEGVRTYCLFIGHARSGHSILGALLDAHPRAVVSDELDALHYFGAGFSRDELMALSIAISRDQAARLRTKRGRDGRPYSYHVPGQWQGSWERLDLVGDSVAGETLRAFAADPSLIERVDARMRPSQVRYVHVVRNPFDNISTFMIRGGRSFDDALERYFFNSDALMAMRPVIGPERIVMIRHEDLVRSARSSLAGVCTFLGLEPGDDYLAACERILFRAPSRSRDAIPWDDAMIAQVQERIDRYPFLSGYDHMS